MDKKVDKILSRLDDLKMERSNLDGEFQELADTFQPGVQSFTISSYPSWQEANRSIDGNGKYLVQKLTSHLFGQLTNPSTKWFQFKPEKNVKTKVNEADLEKLTNKVLSIFNSYESNFPSECQSLYSSMVVFGSGTMYIDNRLGKDISFKSIPLSQIYFAEDHLGMVDSIFRVFKFSTKQAIQAFGKENVSKNLLKTYEQSPEEMVEILHCIYPNMESKKKSDKYESYYIEVESKHILDFKYMKNFPFKIARWAKHVGEKYGHGQGKLALGTIRSLTNIRLENHKALAFSNTPIILLSDDGVVVPESWKPGTVIEGAISQMDGVRRIDTIQPAQNPQAGLTLYEKELELLGKLFFVDDLGMPIDKTRRTATEASLIDQDRLRFVAPFINRIETEFLAPTIETVLQMLEDNGELDDINPELKNIDLEIDFLSPLAKMLKMEDARATQQFLQMSLPLLQFKPEEAVRLNWDKIIKLNRIGSGAPSDVLLSDEEVDGIKQQQAAVQQQQLQMQNALNASQISKNIGQANQYNNSGGL